MATGAGRLTNEQKTAASAIAARMLLTEPCTAKEVVGAVRKASGGAAGDPHRNWIERWLQTMRKDGCAVHTRHGRLTYWGYTAAGRERLELIAKASP